MISIVCSLCSTRQRDWYTIVVSTIGSLRSCATCTGCAFLNASSSVWPLLCFAAVTWIPRERLAVGWWRHLSQTTPIGDNSQAGCTSHTTQYNRWSCVRCYRTSSVDQSAYRRHHRTVRCHLQTAFEDLFVRTIFWRLTNCYICCSVLEA